MNRSRRVMLMGVFVLVAAACTATFTRRPHAGRRQVTVLYVADLHAQLEPHPELLWDGIGKERLVTAGGFARLAKAIRRIRQERNGDLLVLDAGDTFQGSGAAARSRGEVMLRPLNAIGFDAAVPGNWEVVYGASRMRALAAKLDYPYVAANMRGEDDGQRLFRPWFVKSVGGIKVAVVGFTDPDVPLRQPPSYSAGISYEQDDILPGVIAELREVEKPDVVLLLSHVGLHKAEEITRRMDGIDVHLSGDTHERTYEPIVHEGRWTVEPGAFGSFLGRLDLWVENGRIVEKRWELIELTADGFPEDATVATLVEESLAAFRREMSEPVGRIDHPLMRYEVIETSMDRVIADAVREAAGTDIALSNGFRFSPPIVTGPVTRGDVWNALPVNSRLMAGEVTGKQLREFFEREIENVLSPEPQKRFGGWLPRPSGITLRFRAGAPRGRRITEMRVGGALVEDERFYSVAACEREGDAPDTLCRIPHVRNPRVLDIDVHQAVSRYLARDGAVAKSLGGGRRVAAEDLTSPLRSQRTR